MRNQFCGILAVAFACLELSAAKGENVPGAEKGPQPEAVTLDLRDAHEMALRNHPRISFAELSALASQEVTKEARAGYFPQVSANVVAVGTADHNTRLAAIGALNNPSIFDRNAEGLQISQLLTDFGRTVNLTESARLRAKAQENNAQATREQILLEVDRAFYAALQAQAVTRVAEKTVSAREGFLEQVTALASNKLRSDLDVSFARVNVEDAQLLLSRTRNDSQAAYAQLANLMGTREPKTYRLIEQPMPPPLSTNATELVEEGLQSRPDVLRLRNDQQASLKLARAERAARFPVIAAIGSAGVVPIHDPELPDSYAAAGLTMTLPLFAGGFYSARQKEAELRAQAAAESLRELENNVIRDVRIAWLNAQNAFDRLRITSQLLRNAQESYALAQARYQNGLSSIVELNQAELNQVSAQISYANTQYEYLLRRSALSYETGTLH
jgi:outer membrane protein